MKIAFKAKNNKILGIAPTRLIVLSFAALILIGAILLSLPVASNDGKSVGFINALFTATSAACITGLVIADTAKQWTLFGQLVIIGLVQAGGLGIITLATFFSVLLGKKVGLRGMLLAQESISHFSFAGVVRLVKKIVIVTFGIEAIGAVLLSISFVPRYGLKGVYYGVFHAISAFCNAGFDILGGVGREYKSLTEFNNDPIVIYTISGLIIVGGLGFIVWKDLYEYKNTRSLMLHTKVVLIASACLIALGALFFFVFEYRNPLTMGNLTLFEKVNAAVFHSVASRTAGYNSIPLNEMFEISKFVTIILMFIGSAPGSTGGGVKVTTFGVVLMAVISQIRGSDDTVILKHKVPGYVINKALAIIGLSLALVVSVTTVMLAVEKGPLINFLNVLYEATSAFSTVGFSIGISPSDEITGISKLVLMVTMFLGRVGPLSFAIALSLKHRKNRDIVYPEGKIVVG